MSPNPRSAIGIRVRKKDSGFIDPNGDSNVDSLIRKTGDESISSSPTSNVSTSTEPKAKITAKNEHDLESVSEKSVVPKARDAIADSEDGILEGRQGTRYVTLTITRSSGTYVTLVELGDSTPLPTSNSYPVTQAAAAKARSPIPNPGIPTGTIVGIVVGISLGVLALVGVLYVYLLRARHLKEIRRRRRERERARRKSAGSTSGGPAPAAPAPAEGGGEAPFPPANP